MNERSLCFGRLVKERNYYGPYAPSEGSRRRFSPSSACLLLRIPCTRARSRTDAHSIRSSRLFSFPFSSYLPLSLSTQVYRKPAFSHSNCRHQGVPVSTVGDLSIPRITAEQSENRVTAAPRHFCLRALLLLARCASLNALCTNYSVRFISPYFLLSWMKKVRGERGKNQNLSKVSLPL